MGYRSDVMALVYPLSGEHSLLHYDKLKLLMNTTFQDVFEGWGTDYFSWDDEHRVLKFAANHIKWYDGYPDVKRFEEFLSSVQDLEYEYEFIRIGEDDTDVEADSTGDAENYMYVERTIQVNL